MAEMHHWNLVSLSESMDELSFKAGDLIMLNARVGEEWLQGKLISGLEGIFPKKFVEIVVRMICSSNIRTLFRLSLVPDLTLNPIYCSSVCVDSNTQTRESGEKWGRGWYYLSHE